VVLKTFNASSIDYELYFYIRDYTRRHQVLTDVRSRIWYAVQRRGFSIPFPIVDLRPISAERRFAEAELSSQRQECFAALRSLALLAPLSDQELECLALSERVIMYGMGEFIIAKNDPDRSMFVLLSGECDVMVGDDKGDGAPLRQVATLIKGTLFGEMSAFTDSPRSACIVAKTSVSVLKISQSSIQRIFVKNEKALAGIVELIAPRAQIERRRGRALRLLVQGTRIERPGEDFLGRSRSLPGRPAANRRCRVRCSLPRREGILVQFSASRR
jgi:CRP-like cAMP-binding protein